MSIAAIVALLTGIARSIPALASLCEQAIGWLKELDAKAQAQEARDRKAAKDRVVDDAIDRVRSSASRQRQPLD
jgi:hypothetical protein